MSRRRLLVTLGCVWLAMASAPRIARASWSTDSTANNPIATNAATRAAFSVAPDSLGGLLVAWVDYRSGGGRVYAQRLDRAGLPQWGQDGLEVCPGTAGQQGEVDPGTLNTPPPQIVPDGMGGAFVAWADSRDSVANPNLYAQHLSAAGHRLWAPTGNPVCTATGRQHMLRAASDMAGGIILTWSDERTGGQAQSKTYAQRVLANGAAYWSADGVPASNTSGQEFTPAVVGANGGAQGGPGRAIVAWVDYSGPAGGFLWANVLSQSSGTRENSERGRLIGIEGTGHGQTNFVMCGDDSGGVIMVWDDYRPPVVQDRIKLYAARYGHVTANGTVLMPWAAGGVPVCVSGLHPSQAHALAPDGSHGAFVAWAGDQSGPSMGVHLQHLDASGVTWPQDVRVDPVNGPPVSRVSLAPDAFGGVWVCWSSGVGAAIDLHARRVSVSGAPEGLGPQAICVASDAQDLPSLVSDSHGGVIATWWDSRRSPSATDLEAQRIGSGGALGDAPTITAFVPANGGPIGTAVDLFGSGFESPTVWLLGSTSMTNVEVLSSTHMRGLIPSGATTGAFRVENRFGTARSEAVFFISTPGASAGTFFSPPFLRLPQSGQPASVVSGDFDQDGRPDLATANYASRTASVWLGHGDGTFGTRTDIAVQAADQIATADMDGDGILDLVVGGQNWKNTDHFADSVAVLRGLGDGTFAPPRFHFTGGGLGLAVGDLDGDLRADIAVAWSSADQPPPTPYHVSVLWNLGNDPNGTPLFSARDTFPDRGYAAAVAIADLDLDGAKDLLVLNSKDKTTSYVPAIGPSASITLLRNAGNRTFQPMGTVPADMGAWGIAVGDLNGDTAPDLVTVAFSAADGSGSPRLIESLNDGAGGFATQLRFPARGFGPAIVVHDFNADGVRDIAVGYVPERAAGIFMNDGTAQLSPEVVVADTGLGGYGLAVTDFNSDGRPDLASADGASGGASEAGSQSVTILMGRSLDDLTLPPWRRSSTRRAAVALAAGDFDHSGALDCAVLTSSGGVDSLLTLRGDGQGGFLPGSATEVFPSSRFVLSADLDGDTLQDAVVARPAGVTSFRAAAGGQWLAHSDVPLQSVHSLAVADFDHDGHADITASNEATGKVWVLSGDGAGALARRDSIPVTGQATAIGAADMDADGWSDIVIGTTSGAQSFVTVLHNERGAIVSGHYFRAMAPIAVAGRQRALQTADFDGDGRRDAVVAYSDVPTVTLLKGDGEGEFTTLGASSLNGLASSLGVADFDGDGSPDVVVTNAANGSVSYLLNDRTGHLSPVREYGGSPYLAGALAVADLNGDGRPDVVTTDLASPAIEAYLNAAVFAAGNWQTSGISVGDVTERSHPLSSPDGAGGEYVAWAERPAGGTSDNVMLQHLGATGAVAPGWPSGGLSVCNASGNQIPTRVVPDSTTLSDGTFQLTGAIVTWSDARDSVTNGLDVYSQRVVEAPGGGGPLPYWPANGLAVVSRPGVQDESDATSDGSHGVYLVWRDSTAAGPASNSVVVQHVDSTGVSHLGSSDAFGSRGLTLATSVPVPPRPVIHTDTRKGALVGWKQRVPEMPGFVAQSGPVDEVKVSRVESAGTQSWTTTLAGSLAGVREDVRMVGDGSGGAIVAWSDGRSSDRDVYAQRVSGAGTALWTAEGVPLCSITGVQSELEMSAAPGGAYVAWRDGRSMSARVYAQRVDTTGLGMWASGGVPVVSVAGGDQSHPALSTDASGGLFVLYEQGAGVGNTDLYASRLTGSGAAASGWTSGGLAVATGLGVEDSPRLVGDFSGGAIATWHAAHADTSAIRAAHLSGSGQVVGVQDVPAARSTRLSLSRARPNPSRGVVSFTVTMPARGAVEAEVLDVQGRRVATLWSRRELEPGEHELRWNAGASPGLYFVRVRTATQTDVRRVVRLR